MTQSIWQIIIRFFLLSMCAYVHEYRYMLKQAISDPLELEFTGSYELPNIGARNQLHVIGKKVYAIGY